MSAEHQDQKLPVRAKIDRSVIPPDEPVKAGELRRRRELYKKVMYRRSAMQPLDIPADELIRQEEPGPARHD